MVRHCSTLILAPSVLSSGRFSPRNSDLGVKSKLTAVFTLSCFVPYECISLLYFK